MMCIVLSKQNILTLQNTSGKRGSDTKMSYHGCFLPCYPKCFTGETFDFLLIPQGSNLDSNAKMWRLVADLMNDLGILCFPFTFMFVC